VAPSVEQHIYNYRRKFITPQAFGQHLRYLTRHYTVLQLDEALERLRQGTLPPYALVITFDDGYRNFYDYAVPTLKRYNVPATIFIATDFILRGIPLWVDRLEYAVGHTEGSRAAGIARDTTLRAKLKSMTQGEREQKLQALEGTGATLKDFADDRMVYAPLTRDMLKDMQNYGITIGAHTRSHPILSTLPLDKARDEIAGSAQELREAVGAISSVFAYPNGQHNDYNEETITSIKEAGFTSALTTIEGSIKRGDDPYELRRITLDGVEDDASLAAATSGLRALLRATIPYA